MLVGDDLPPNHGLASLLLRGAVTMRNSPICHPDRQTVSKLPTEVLVRERKAEEGFLFTNRVKRSRLGVRRVVGGVR